MTKTAKKKKEKENKEKESKPLVKKFYDLETEIKKFIILMLPHVPYTTIQDKFLYTKQNGNKRYRINYMSSEGKIVQSKVIEISVKQDNKLELIII